MDYSASFQISASGMALEKLRLDVSTSNIANINSSAASVGQLYQPLRVIGKSVALNFTSPFSSSFSNSFSREYGKALVLENGGGVALQAVVPLSVAPRLVHEPGHPQADENGNVHFPGINHNSEMVNVLTALRAYESNVVALTAAKTMAVRTLEIGGQ
jgi:flagellar basal-body rod protein FlgC